MKLLGDSLNGFTVANSAWFCLILARCGFSILLTSRNYDKLKIKNIEIVSVEPTSMGKFWVFTQNITSRVQDTEMIVAVNYSEAIVKFSNLMIEQAKQ